MEDFDLDILVNEIILAQDELFEALNVAAAVETPPTREELLRRKKERFPTLLFTPNAVISPNCFHNAILNILGLPAEHHIVGSARKSQRDGRINAFLAEFAELGVYRDGQKIKGVMIQ